MKLIKFFCAAFIGIVGLNSCTKTSNDAEKFISNLPENSVVYSTDLIDPNTEIIYSQVTQNGELVILATNLNEATTDSVMIVSEGDICEVVKTKNGYLVVTKTDLDPMHSYYAYHINVINKKNNTESNITIGEEGEDIPIEAYIIDPREESIILKGSFFDDQETILYHTVYDFEGDKILEDPILIDLRPRISDSSQTNSSAPAMYVWECQKCGKKRNSAGQPETNFFVDVCPIKQMPHEYVMIGKL